MHGVRLDTVPEGQEQQAAKRIMRQNEKYHPFLGMVLLMPKWAKNFKENNISKQYSSLLVELSTLEAANKVMEKSLVGGYQLKIYTKYNRAGALLLFSKIQTL